MTVHMRLFCYSPLFPYVRFYFCTGSDEVHFTPAFHVVNPISAALERNERERGVGWGLFSVIMGFPGYLHTLNFVTSKMWRCQTTPEATLSILLIRNDTFENSVNPDETARSSGSLFFDL